MRYCVIFDAVLRFHMTRRISVFTKSISMRTVMKCFSVRFSGDVAAFVAYVIGSLL